MVASPTLIEQHRGGLRLLVLQPTPFCNIDCSYCYLADRTDKSRMSADTVLGVLDNLLADGLIGSELDLCWHLGEPLTVGRPYYEDMVPRIARFADGKFIPRHTFQTNGVLIDPAWCAFFKRIDAYVGLSLDGPEEFHDANRITRSGKGTHARVTAGLRLLQQWQVKRYIIAVLGPQALRHPDRIFEYFTDLAETNVCFNIEETEGINISRTAGSAGACADTRIFFRRFLERLNAAPGKLWNRDLQQMLGLLMTARNGGCHNENNTPFRIVSVAWDGSWTTFSPELITTAAPQYGHFRFGNLAREPVSRAVERQPFIAVARDIQAGIDRCRAECSYFSVCGGGAPSNKFSELGTLCGTETFACRSMVKSLADGCMDFIEANVLHGGAADAAAG